MIHPKAAALTVAEVILGALLARSWSSLCRNTDDMPETRKIPRCEDTCPDHPEWVCSRMADHPSFHHAYAPDGLTLRALWGDAEGLVGVWKR